MFRGVINQIRTKSLNTININCVQHQCIQLLSTSKLANQLLDDSEELDPELIESFPPETDEIAPQQQEYLQQLYIHQQRQQQQHNIKQPETECQPPLPPPIKSESIHKLSTTEIQDRQKKVWSSISNTLQGIWLNMDSIDKTNVKRIDKVYKKLTLLETLHVKNIQHSLHHIAKLRDEVSTVNSRINYVFQRLSDLEKTAPSEWLEWTVAKCEIPFEEGVYLRSPGYEVGSMIWCIELRWEIDENVQDSNKEHAADIAQEINEANGNEMDGEYARMDKGYNRLGIYVSPRSVANWERLSSLKATCEVRVNENDYSEMSTVGADKNVTAPPADKVSKKQQHFSVSGEFLRGRKLTSWGRTMPNGDEFFDKNKIDDEVCIKLRIVNQTLSYQEYAENSKDEVVCGVIAEKDMDVETQTNEFENFNFKDKQSKIFKQQKENEISDAVEEYMSMKMNEFWKLFSEQVESAKSKQGFSIVNIAKSCELDAKLVGIFRKGPMIAIYEDDVDAEDKNKNENINAKKRSRRNTKMLNRKLVESKQWHRIVEYDANNPDFRRKLATFLVKHQYKKQRKLQSKASF